jgi:hypothetical protein
MIVGLVEAAITVIQFCVAPFVRSLLWYKARRDTAIWIKGEK